MCHHITPLEPATGRALIAALDRPPCEEDRTENQAVVIEVFKGLASVDPPAMEFAERKLEYAETTFEAAGRLGHRSRRIKKRLYDMDERGRLVVPAGVIPGLVEHLQRGGLRVEVRDHRRRPQRCQVTNELRCELSEFEQTYLSTVAANPQGQIVVRGQREQVRAIEIICRYFPEALVLIPVATKSRMNELHDALKAPLRGFVSEAKGRDWWRDSNRVVCTYSSFETALQADILIFTEPATMFNSKHNEAIKNLPGMQLRYGITRVNQVLDHVTRLRLEAYLGPVIFQSPDPRGEPVPVEVMLVEAPFMHPAGPQEALERKRHLYWRNPSRNQMIAEVAVAAASGNQETLWQYGLGLGQDDDERFGKPARVAVLVESVNHGLVLEEELPGWRLHSAAPPAGPARIWTLPDRAIITATFATTLPELATDVLVAASGGDALGDLKGFPPRRRQGPGKPLTVIDFADDCDQQASKQTQRRLESYRLRGWRVTAPRRWTVS